MAELLSGNPASKSAFALKHVAASLLVAFLVAWIDWGGIDRSMSDRGLAGIFAWMCATGVIGTQVAHRFRSHPSWVAAQYCGTASAAFFTVAMLADGVVAIGFAVPGVVCLAAEFANLRAYRRAIADGSAFPERASVGPLAR